MKRREFVTLLGSAVWRFRSCSVA